MRGAARGAVFSDVIPEGGHQDPKAHLGMHLTQSITRAPLRCMYPDEFVSVLWQHRHPRWPTIGVTSSRATDHARQRDTVFGSCGTIYVANATEFRDLFVVPANCLPYSSIKTAVWSEERTRWEGGEVVRGWRQALVALLNATYLEPSPELSWLIGQDSYSIFPIEARP